MQTAHPPTTEENKHTRTAHEAQPESSPDPKAGATAGMPLFLQSAVSIGQNPPSTYIQAKLAISQPGDVYEQEADRVAEQVISSAPTQEADRVSDRVMHMSEPGLERACACGG